MSENKKNEMLYEGITGIRDDLIDKAESYEFKKAKKVKNVRIRWIAMATVAAAFVIVMIGSNLRNSQSLVIVEAYAITEAEYPQMAPYPIAENSYMAPHSNLEVENPEQYPNIDVESSYTAPHPEFDQEYDAWIESVEAQRRENGYADGLESFFSVSIKQFLSGSGTENKAFSPINVYMALAMLTELTNGNSRQQILDLLGAENIETLRKQANDVWNANYRNDTATTSILASSLWLNENITFHQSTMDRLAKNYYASSYRGKMGSEEFNSVLQTWLNEQTGGMLEEQAGNIKLDSNTVMALATTIFFQAKWKSEFNSDKTEEAVFYGVDSNETCEYMHSSDVGSFYWGENFGATDKILESYGGTMYFILPDEGVNVEDLLNDEEVMNFIQDGYRWENTKRLNINLALPKFDITSQMDLNKGLKTLGITDVFDENVSDFSPMTTDEDEIYVSKTQHDVRVAIDEEGVTATAYTVMPMCSAGMPPEDEMDFILNRPFLFVINSRDGLPLFVGVVNQP